MPPSTSKPTYPPSSRSSCQAWCRCGRCLPCLTASNLQWRHITTMSSEHKKVSPCLRERQMPPNAGSSVHLETSSWLKEPWEYCWIHSAYLHLSIWPGWWLTYPSEKYDSQWEGWHPIYYGKQKMFQTTNQWLILSSSVFWRWPHILGAKRSAKGTTNPSWTEWREIVEESRIFSGQHWAVLPLQGWWRLPKSKAS